ncbi:N-ethylammeline chlorohydrolase [Streptococcus pneumoniae]|nr:N-ethylammeline chlorohydrolase [Streptococcus pneumoniae]
MKLTKSAYETNEVSSKHVFEVVDETNEVSSKHVFEVADRTDEVSNVVDRTDEVSKHLRQGNVDVV